MIASFVRATATQAHAGISMNHDSYDDSYIRGILNTVKTIAMVGISPKDVRPSYFAFKYLLIYFAFVAVTGLAFIALQRHQSSLIARFNKELGQANEFLSALAKKIAKYLPPQLYRGIFAGKTSRSPPSARSSPYSSRTWSTSRRARSGCSRKNSRRCSTNI